MTTWTRSSSRWSPLSASQLIALPGVGLDTAGELLVTAGDNPERLRSERSFARRCGVAPDPVSSGRTWCPPAAPAGTRCMAREVPDRPGCSVHADVRRQHCPDLVDPGGGHRAVVTELIQACEPAERWHGGGEAEHRGGQVVLFYVQVPEPGQAA